MATVIISRLVRCKPRTTMARVTLRMVPSHPHSGELARVRSSALRPASDWIRPEAVANPGLSWESTCKTLVATGRKTGNLQSRFTVCWLRSTVSSIAAAWLRSQGEAGPAQAAGTRSLGALAAMSTPSLSAEIRCLRPRRASLHSGSAVGMHVVPLGRSPLQNRLDVPTQQVAAIRQGSRRGTQPLEIFCFGGIALLHGKARIPGLLPFRLGPGEWEVGAHHAEQLVRRANLRSALVPSREGGQWHLHVRHTNSGNFVAVPVHLGDQHGKGLAQLRRFDGHDTSRTKFGSVVYPVGGLDMGGQRHAGYLDR